MKLFILWIAVSASDLHVEQAEFDGVYTSMAECRAQADKINAGDGWAWCEEEEK